MIPVLSQPEPANFDAMVRRPGRNFLSRTANPSSKEFRSNAFWKSSANDLHAAYSGVCAYSCFYMMRSGATTDHFLPKSSYPYDAYEWSNFRLSTHRLNTAKGESTEVIDPFVVQSGWFVLKFPSCLVFPGDGVSEVVKQQVIRTIDVLGLNRDDQLVQERCSLMVEYASGQVDLGFLARRYPFLASEIVRQGLQGRAANIFKMRHGA